MSKSIKLLAIMIGAFVFTAFLFRHLSFDISIWIAVAGVGVIILIPFMIPSVGTFIVSRPRKIFWTGIVLVIAGLGGLLVISFTSAFYGIPKNITGNDAVSMATLYVMMAGIALTVLPRSVAAQQRLNIAIAKPREVQPKLRPAFNIRHGWNANITMVRRMGSFLRVAGLWIVLLWAVPFVGIHLAAHLYGLSPKLLISSSAHTDAVAMLLGLNFLSSTITAIAFPTVLVAWHRFILEERIPRIAPLPDMAAMRYLFRLWMIVLLAGLIVTLTFSNAPDLARLLGTNNNLPAAIAILAIAAGLFVYRGSQFALVLPAIALGNRNFLGAESAYVTRRLGMTYPIGFLIALLPFGLLALASGAALYYSGLPESVLSAPLDIYALQLIPLTTVFLALSSCATYVSWTYAMRVKEYAELTSPSQAAQ